MLYPICNADSTVKCRWWHILFNNSTVCTLFKSNAGLSIERTTACPISLPVWQSCLDARLLTLCLFWPFDSAFHHLGLQKQYTEIDIDDSIYIHIEGGWRKECEAGDGGGIRWGKERPGKGGMEGHSSEEIGNGVWGPAGGLYTREGTG